MSTQTVRYPDINTKPIYDGQFRDTAPSIKSAGKLTALDGETVYHCLKPKGRPPSPDVIRRFRRTFRPDSAKKTIFYGKAFDPQQQWAEDYRHGLSTHSSVNVGKLVNPKPKTLFKQKRIERKEKQFLRNQRAPLGKSHDQRTGLPPGLDPQTHTFGVPMVADEGAGVLVNPPKTYAQVNEESAIGHDNYIASHKDYRSMERVSRHYKTPFRPDKYFGAPTYCDPTGKMAWRSLRWPCETEKEKATKIVNKRVDDFRDTFQATVGHFLDPIKETMRVGPDHAFGQPLRPDGFGMNELLHDRLPKIYPEGSELQRGLIPSMRQRLKDLHFHCFPELIHALRFYDKEGKGKIDKDDVREACLSFNLPLDVWLLEQVLDFMDEDRDGQVDYQQFAKYLDWKEKLPPDFAYVKYNYKKFLKKMPQRGKQNVMEPTTFRAPTTATAAAASARVQKSIDRALADHHTSAEMVHAVAGPTGLDTTGFRAYGLPTIRSDLAPPLVRRLDDRQNYGDESTAYGLTNPSVYNHHGVHEKHLLIPRTKQEIQEIFANIGVDMTADTVDAIYDRVSCEHPKSHVSVGTFRATLDEVQRAQIATGEHPLVF